MGSDCVAQTCRSHLALYMAIGYDDLGLEPTGFRPSEKLTSPTEGADGSLCILTKTFVDRKVIRTSSRKCSVTCLASFGSRALAPCRAAEIPGLVNNLLGKTRDLFAALDTDEARRLYADTSKGYPFLYPDADDALRSVRGLDPVPTSQSFGPAV